MNRFKRKSAQITRWMLYILALSAIIVGCGEDPYPSELAMSYDDSDEFRDWWEVVCFTSYWTVNEKIKTGRNQVVFTHTGEFIHKGWYFQRDWYSEREWYDTDPGSFISVSVAYTTRGYYRTRGTLLTITGQKTQVDVDVEFGPEAASQLGVEGMSLEALESAKVSEIKNGLQQELPLFKNDTEYTWEIEDNALTLSNPREIFILSSVSLLSENLVD